ncbi:MAG TPA: hypothetical protein VL357_11390 [Rariglobus sp.]|jgi:hypothetical protein|nr:hypothetical protein [Rariglobus sp.]
MKTFFAVVLSTLVLALTGCGTVGSDFTANVREKFAGPTYRTKVVTGDSKAVYEAALVSVDKLGFRVVGGGAAQGRIEALSGLSASDSLKGTRQLAMKVKLSPVASGGIEAAVLITEQVEDDFNKGAGQATETTLRNTPLYDVFFRSFEEALAAK